MAELIHLLKPLPDLRIYSALLWRSKSVYQLGSQANNWRIKAQASHQRFSPEIDFSNSAADRSFSKIVPDLLTLYTVAFISLYWMGLFQQFSNFLRDRNQGIIN
ncbi:MAG: hypothetical protein KME20_05685 [Kaiparowitsia implicata GSE-PSE-MK54-09C]|jgi:hypothetical protein|nr:hypothetical protein [Kaiparowitsia implicata GSE-PSE-MK54-09C]